MTTRSSPTAQLSPRSSQSWSRALQAIFILSFIALSGCATTSPTYHRYLMQGQILSVDGSTLTICIGDRDGAKVGQLLDVVRHVQRPSSPKSSTPIFAREEVGVVRIASVIDEHYSTAEVLEGNPKQSDSVEMERK